MTFSEAALGAQVEVPTIDGRVKLRVPPGSADGRQLRLAGKGAPRLKGEGRGALIAKLRVQVPRELSDDQREALERVRRARGRRPAGERCSDEHEPRRHRHLPHRHRGRARRDAPPDAARLRAPRADHAAAQRPQHAPLLRGRRRAPAAHPGAVGGGHEPGRGRAGARAGGAPGARRAAHPRPGRRAGGDLERHRDELAAARAARGQMVVAAGGGRALVPRYPLAVPRRDGRRRWEEQA